MMIKLNKVYGWEPDPYYNITEVTPQGFWGNYQQLMFSFRLWSCQKCPDNSKITYRKFGPKIARGKEKKKKQSMDFYMYLDNFHKDMK